MTHMFDTFNMQKDAGHMQWFTLPTSQFKVFKARIVHSSCYYSVNICLLTHYSVNMIGSVEVGKAVEY